MDYLDFIASIIDSVTWPLTVFSIILIFRHPISKLLLKLTRFKYKELEADFNKSSIPSQGEQLVRKIQEIGLSVGDNLNYFRDETKLVIADAKKMSRSEVFEQFLLSEELIFRKLEAEFGKQVDRKVEIRTRKGRFQFDGVLTKGKRDISVIEVKLTKGATISPHTMIPVLSAVIDAKEQIMESRGSATSFSLLLAIVTTEPEEIQNKLKERAKELTKHSEVPVEVRIFNLNDLKKEFGIMS